MDNPKIKRALISLTDKSGIEDFARALSEEFGVEIVSTGGTARVLAEAGIPVRAIDDLTGFPEMMDGRVKTLHPKVHGGLLARRDSAQHMAEAEEHGIGLIDMIVVNLYAFEATVAKPDVTYEDAIEHIDIGGPSMLRSAAKNHASVTVVTNPATYDDILAEMRANDGATTYETRQRLAMEVYRTTSAYDNAIFNWMSGQLDAENNGADGAFPQSKRIFAEKEAHLRYGENPHQEASFYKIDESDGGKGNADFYLANAKQYQGKEMSYNNWLDTDAAWAAVREFDEPACVIVKHQTPCGIALGEDALDAYQKAYRCDPISAFGGVMAFNREVTGPVVTAAIFENKQFIEVIVAPSFDAEARMLLGNKPNCRVLATGGINEPGLGVELRAIEGGLLVQQRDAVVEDPAEFTVPTKRQPTEAEMAELLFAWTCCRTVKSNAIVISKDRATIGAGAGQPNRVDSARNAIRHAGDECEGAVAASDAFLPFSDTLEVLAEAGVTALIQPGGSIRDEESIAAADERGIAMVFTGHRHFRH